MRIKVLTLGLLAAAPLFLQAQEVTYSLPSTTLILEVDAVKETFFAGPYAPFAKKYLGLTVRQDDEVRSYVKGVRMAAKVEADPSVRYSVSGKDAEDRFLALSAQGLVAFRQAAEADAVVWRFTPPAAADFSGKGLTSTLTTEVVTTYRDVQTDTSFTRIPVQQSVQVAKSPEKKAQEAAEIILDARKERFNISTGNTDATFSGEALGAALAELSRIEQEYLTLFTGYTVTENQHASYDVTPVPMAKEQRYPAFRLSGQDGLVPEGRFSGDPYYLEFDTVEVPDVEGLAAKSGSKSRVIHYRIPAICVVRLTGGNDQLFQARVPVYQLGRDCTYPLSK
ncbi:MAG: DUF4831 family protein [Bacteroidales bacterium]|nr:DUF4831 family protein [Bacteroidales bacterium]